MPFPLYGAPGCLFDGWGKMGAIVSEIDALHVVLEPALIDLTTGVLGQLNSFPILGAQVGGTYVNLLGSVEQPCSSMQSLAQNFINALVYAYQAQYNQNLTTPNLPSSIAFVLQQMAAQNATVLQMTVGAVIGAFSGTGNGVVNISLKRPSDGRFLENAFQELVLFTCSSDSYSGSSAAFNERFLVTGQGSEPDVFAFDWPLGSNGITSINAINGDASNSAGNLLTNSGFTLWTLNVPNKWTLAVGTAGVNIQQNSSIVYSAGSSAQIIGDGLGTLTSLVQAFKSSSTGTPASLTQQTQLSVNLFLRCGGTIPSQGVLQVDLIDGSGTIITDQAGTPNVFTVDLTTLSVNWSSAMGGFRLPIILPSSYSFRMHLTTPLPNGVFIYVDKVSCGLMNQLYVQGPFVAVHSGSIPFVQSPVPDQATCQITNSRGAGGTLNTWQTLLFRLLPLGAQTELIWPSSPSPSVSDGLI